MSTRIFDPHPEKDESEFMDLIKQQRWYIKEVLMKKVPWLALTVTSLIRYIILDKSFKLPITSNSNNHLKGIISRESYNINELSLIIEQLPYFHHGKPYKIQLKDNVIELHQIKSALQVLKFLLFKVIQLRTFLENLMKHEVSDLVSLKYHLLTLKKFNQVLELVLKISDLFNNPIQKELFPNSHLEQSIFEPELEINKLSIDLYLNSGEIFIELIFLKRITTKPWCLINDHNISFNEFINDKIVLMKKHNINSLIEYFVDEKHWPEFWKYDGRNHNNKINNSIKNPNDESGTWFNKLWNNISNGDEANQLFLNRNIRFNNGVFWITKNFQIKISDPILIIINIKLNSIKQEFHNILVNLKCLIVNDDFLKPIVNKDGEFKRFLKKESETGEYQDLIKQIFSSESTTEIENPTEEEINDVILSYLKSKGSTGSFDNSLDSSGDEDIKLDYLLSLKTGDFSNLITDYDNEIIKQFCTSINTENDNFCCDFDVL